MKNGDKLYMVSIIVPLFKGQQYLCKLIEMASQNQKYINYRGIKVELLLINDYPKIPLKKEKIQNEGLIVKYIENDENIGIHRTKIQGLQLCEGEYIVFLDQDDTIMPNYLESQLERLGTYGAVFCNGYWRKGELIFNLIQNKEFCLEKYLEIGYPLISLGQLLIRKAFIPQEWKEVPLTENGWDDHFLWACLMYHKISINYNEQPLYTHEENGNNESFNWSAMKRSGIDFEQKYLRTHILSGDQEKQFKKLVEKKLEKYDKYIILDKLFEKVNPLKLQKYLKKYEYNRIAIYGMGIYGKKLYEELEKSDIKVIYGIDKNATNKHLKIPMYTELQQNIYVDIIICATGFDDDNIIKHLNLKAITLLEILNNIE